MDKQKISNFIVVAVSLLIIINTFFLSGTISRVLAIFTVLIALGNLIWLYTKK